jgi:hypothetical protein
MYERCRRQAAITPLAAQTSPRDALQLVMDERSQPRKSLIVSCPPRQ